MAKLKYVTIENGCDWADAGYVTLQLSATMNMQLTYKDYLEWRKQNKYISFEAWLIKFKKAKEACIEIFHED